MGGGSCKQPEELAEEDRLKVLDGDLTLEGVASFIKSGKAKNIVVMAGAGVSVSAGIPDFRTPGTGLYDNLQKYDLPQAEAIFGIEYFKDRPEPFNELSREMLPGRYFPTPTHFFIKLLEAKGLLKRLYTQNIDTLEILAGISEEKTVFAHGSFADAHCIDCGKQQRLSTWEEKLQTEKVPRCDHCQNEDGIGGLVKPDIVFFGEGLPVRFGALSPTDLKEADLLLVIGTSLQVGPFNTLAGKCDELCPRVLINREKVCLYKGEDPESDDEDAMSNRLGNAGFRFALSDNYRDVFLGGNCDDAIRKLAVALGWETELDDRVKEAKAVDTRDMWKYLCDAQPWPAPEAEAEADAESSPKAPGA